MLRLTVYVFIFIIFCITFTYDEVNSYSIRSKRFLFLFPFYRILPGNPCRTSTNLQGVCLTQRQCNARNGVCSGSCANNKGVCCVYQRTCGGTSNANITYFVNPNYPSTYSTGISCTITVNKINSGICQMRIDFIEMSITEPNGNGVCNNDFLNLGNEYLPKICGENTGQHVYVDFVSGSNSHLLTIDSLNSAVCNRRWNLQISQIACNSSNRAPSGCLKYFTGVEGTDYSFNYYPSSSAGGGLANRQLAGLNYGVCIRNEAGYCTIQWSQAANDKYSFTVSSNTTYQLGIPLNGTNCVTNYIVVPNPSFSNGTSIPYDRFCGNALTTIQTMSRPFVLYVVTALNSTESNTGNRGFHLNFRQSRCTRTLT
ncbi:uncharacterized protein LOC142329296 [Lycorma delicatula]|uniref:uncharacterized protein LOC142329296 n=1 Tax=Lycorma delicatula TaxID=130591 RepID=UPI003F50E6BF